MSKKPVILVVDDEPQILRVMRASLPARGYEVLTARSGKEAVEILDKDKDLPDLIILDLVMPEMSGLDVCRFVRSFSSVPILVLSAKGSEPDKVAALDLGADDYVTKPFGIDELLARVRAVLRRIPVPETPANAALIVDDITIELGQRRVSVGDRQVKLTPKEFDVLKYLMSHAGEVVTHRELLKAVWGWQSVEQTKYLWVVINQLRRKIEPDPQNLRYILTEPWVGYRFAHRTP